MRSVEEVPVDVKVWGDFACFTRPEMKVERVSYPVMTPSAARGILETIFWKPQFTWDVTEIWVLNPIRYTSVMRNEITTRQTVRAAERWQRRGGGFSSTDDRSQRHTLALRDVSYIIKAHVVVKPGVDEDPAKFRDQFRRRVRSGRCFATPYLGCREFWASFSPPDGDDTPLPVDEELGRMLKGMDYEPRGFGRATPRFFEARLDRGVLRVPTQA